jgi:putative membrane protein
MDRRIVLTGLVALAASPALSQQSGGASSSSMSSGGSANQADMQHMQQTMMLGMMSLETSKLALEKARNDDLKQFARFETNEQTTLGRDPQEHDGADLHRCHGLVGVSSGGTSMQMDAKGREMVQKLSKASGRRVRSGVPPGAA